MPFLRPRLAVAFLAVAWLPAAAQAQGGLWQDMDEPAMLGGLGPQRRASAKRVIVPEAYRTLRLDLAGMRTRLAAAAPEFSGPIEQTGLELSLPLPYGGFGRFLVLESPIMEKALAEKFPELKTYVAQGIDDPTATARLDVTPRGFRAIVLSARGQFFIDPYWKDDDRTYLAYYKRQLSAGGRDFRCLTEAPANAIDTRHPGVLRSAPQRPTGATLRTYRLALAATGEYTAAVSGTTPGTVLQALGAMVTTMNRVSAIFERDLAMRLILVANNEQLIFTNASTDPYSNNDASSMLGQNQGTIDSLIGSANYDLGHVFSTGGGGLVNGGACVASGKARGVTGQANPTQDPFDVDYVAHEMGHQFGASHTFNSALGNCTTNRVGSSAYEPGSGSTIMAYAGICLESNLAPNSDDYFHTRSYDQIDLYTSAGQGNCAATSATGNTPPVIVMPASVTIPVLTPFALTAGATDVDGDALTWCWEEFDLGPASEPSIRDNGSSPLFRSYDPVTSPTRFFPSLRFVLDATANVPAGSNQPPVKVGGIALAETLPTTSRAMVYRVTVRDNRLGGGGSNYGAVTVTSTTAAGPFRISNLNTAATFAGGSTLNLTWDVANSAAAPVNCANVKISLSTDGGLSFPFVLAASVPNNGSASVSIPNVAQIATAQGRIKIEAVGNIFFDINKANLTFTSSNAPPTLALQPFPNVVLTRGAAAPVIVAVGTVTDSNGNPLGISFAEVPPEASVSATIGAGGAIHVSAQAGCSLTTTVTSRTYPIKLIVTDSLGSTASGTIDLIVQPNPAPTLGAYANADLPRDRVTFIAPLAPPADANGNLPAAPLTVSPTTIPGGGTLAIDQATGVITATTTAGSTLGAFNVRVTVADTCGATLIRQFTATVTAATPAAPQFVSAAPPPLTVGSTYSHTFVATGSPAPSFALVAGALPPGLALSAAGVLSGMPTSAGSGSFPDLTVRASNGVNPSADQTFTLTARTVAANYLAGYGLSGADAAPSADPNRDGVANLLAYAFGLDPTVPSAGLLPVAGLRAYHGVNHLSLTFHRSSVATDLIYVVQASDDLQSWSTIAVSAGGAMPSGPGFFGETGSAPNFTVEIRDPEPVDGASGGQRFLRLQVQGGSARPERTSP